MQCYLCGGDAVERMALCIYCAIKELPKLEIEGTRIAERCSTCLRYSIPPLGWVHLRYEGPEMLSYLLKKVPGIEKIALKEAEFVHSEEHSKKLCVMVKIDRSKELKEYEIEHSEEVLLHWRIRPKHCLDCARIASNQTWSSVVQLRQKSNSKRTLLVIEQAILKAGLHHETTDIKGVADGIDFFFRGRTPALKLIRFIEKMHPARTKSSEELVKMDKKSHNSRYKFAYSIEIPGVNKDDLVYLPKELAKKLSLDRVCIVWRVAKSISLIDSRGYVKELGKIEYFKYAKEIKVIASEKSLVTLEVVEAQGEYKRKTPTQRETETLNYGKNVMEDIVLLRNTGEFVETKTFLKGLSAGEKVLGYDVEDLYTDIELGVSVIPVKREIMIGRNWRIRRLSGVAHADKDVEMLIDEAQNNPSLLKSINLYDENNELVEKVRMLKVS